MPSRSGDPAPVHGFIDLLRAELGLPRAEQRLHFAEFQADQSGESTHNVILRVRQLTSMMTYTLSPVQQAAMEKTAADWKAHNKVERLWTKDPSLWTGKDEGQWMGWLGIVEEQLADLPRFREFAGRVRERGYRDVLLLGMGGSSLCPEVMAHDVRQDGGISGNARARFYRSRADSGDREED